MGWVHARGFKSCAIHPSSLKDQPLEVVLSNSPVPWLENTSPVSPRNLATTVPQFGLTDGIVGSQSLEVEALHALS
jgi:hypothetical protein